MEETGATTSEVSPGQGFPKYSVPALAGRQKQQQEAQQTGPHFLRPTWPCHTPHRSLRERVATFRTKSAIDTRLGHATSASRHCKADKSMTSNCFAEQAQRISQVPPT